MVWASNLLEVSLASWKMWAIPAASVVGAGFAAFVISKWVHGARPEPITEAPKPEPAPDPFVTGSSSEKRTSHRREGNPVEIVLSEKEPKTELLRGWVIDRSLGGLCLRLGCKIKKGTILSIRPKNAPLGTLWIQIEIRSCREVEGDWETGCRFVRPPSWSQLLLFN